MYPPPVLAAALPPGVPLAGLYSLFDAVTGVRLPAAREPNGDAETQMQPQGWALARGNVNGSLPFGAPGTAPVHVEVRVPARNNSAFPYWGRDEDPRNPPTGYVWFGEGGGAASWMAENKTFWANKTLPGGLQWNASGGAQPCGLSASPFSAAGWAARAPGRRAHVFHDSLWGNWGESRAAAGAPAAWTAPSSRHHTLPRAQCLTWTLWMRAARR